MSFETIPGVSFSQKKLKARPIQAIEFAEGVILKRGATEIKIGGETAAEVVQFLLDRLSGEGASQEEIVKLFAAPDRPIVEDLLDRLVERRILLPADEVAPSAEKTETNLDIFYWGFEKQPEQVAKQLSSLQIAVVGVNLLSRQIASSLVESGVENIQSIDDSMLRNLEFFDANGSLKLDRWSALSPPPLDDREWENAIDVEKVDCLIATSDFGSQDALRKWNEFCVQNNIHFLPVTLRDAIGEIGPLVVPGETACLECLRARQNSHLRDISSQRVAEQKAFAGQNIRGFHPLMLSILGNLAAFEMLKFYAQIPKWQVGKLIEVNLLAGTMSARKVLKVPRCQVCSSLNRQASTKIKQTANIPGW